MLQFIVNSKVVKKKEYVMVKILLQKKYY